MDLKIFYSLGLAIALSVTACGVKEEKAILAHAPEVPPQLNRSGNTKVIVELETKELKGRLADGVEIPLLEYAKSNDPELYQLLMRKTQAP